jgi:hypothetical protein
MWAIAGGDSVNPVMNRNSADVIDHFVQLERRWVHSDRSDIAQHDRKAVALDQGVCTMSKDRTHIAVSCGEAVVADGYITVSIVGRYE